MHPITFFFIISKTKKWFDYCNLAVTLLSFLCFFLQALILRAQQKPPRERHHSRPYNALLLPPQLHKCSSLTMSARVSFHLSSLFFHAAYSFVFISCFNLLVLHVCCMCPTKQWFLQSLQLLKCNRTHTMKEAAFC